MRSSVHLSIVTSSSMILTFVLYCVMEHLPSRYPSSRFHWIDIPGNYGFMINCYHNIGIMNVKCTYVFTKSDIGYQIIFFPLVFIGHIVFCYFPKLETHVYNAIYTLLILDLLEQYVGSFNLSFEIDIITVFCFIWQFTSLVSKWIWSGLLPPILIIEHTSFCVHEALEAWLGYFIVYRYIPLPLLLVWLWSFAVMDIFLCLHYEGRLYHTEFTHQKFLSKKKSPSDFYCVDGIDNWKTSNGLGLMDFNIYNLLILFALSHSWSILVKIVVTFGTIVSVQVGLTFTRWLRSIIKNASLPGLPLPIITFSTYLFVLDVIMSNNFNECTEF